MALPGSGDPLAVWNGAVPAVAVFGPALIASVNVPNQPGLVGQAFGWQGLTIDAGGVFQPTNAHPLLLHGRAPGSDRGIESSPQGAGFVARRRDPTLRPRQACT